MKALPIFLLFALLLMTTLVKSDPAPEVCEHGVATLFNNVPSAWFSHVAPCKWILKFPDRGRWRLITHDPLKITKHGSYPQCHINISNVLIAKGTKVCAIVLVVHERFRLPGTSYRFGFKRVSD